MSRAFPIVAGAALALVAAVALASATTTVDCRLEPVGRTASHTVYQGACP